MTRSTMDSLKGNCLHRQWNDDIGRALMTQEKVLGLIGVWPLDAESFKSTFRWSLAMIIQISTISTLSLEVHRRCLDADDTMDAFLMDLSSMVSLSKLLLVRFNWKYTYTLVRSVLDDWSIVEDPRHRLIMTKYSNRGRFVSLTILYLGYASGVSFIIKAIPLDILLPSQISSLNSTETSKIHSDHGLDVTYFLATSCVFGSLSVVPHGCVLILQVAQIYVNATSHCASDGFFFSLMMHLCGQFEVLKMNFSELEIEGCQRELKILIRRHCRLALLVDSLEETFTMVILVQLLMSALLLCVEGFQLIISLSINDNVSALKHGTLVVTMLVQLYLYAYAGDSLESQTGEIGLAVYGSPWYNCRGRGARDLILIINRGITPHQVTAGKFLPMNLSTFKEIVKASVSYLSVLRVMMET